MSLSYEIDLMAPPYGKRIVSGEELPAVYAELKQAASPSVTWGSMDDGAVLIVAVGDDYSVVTMGADDTFYYLQTKDDDEPVTVDMGGTDGEVPGGAIVPRELGLEVLLRADDFTALRTDYMWVEQ